MLTPVPMFILARTVHFHCVTYFIIDMRCSAVYLMKRYCLCSLYAAQRLVRCHSGSYFFFFFMRNNRCCSPKRKSLIELKLRTNTPNRRTNERVYEICFSFDLELDWNDSVHLVEPQNKQQLHKFLNNIWLM